MTFFTVKTFKPKKKITIGTFLPLDFTGSKESNSRNNNEIPVSGNEEDTVPKGTIQLGRFV